MAAHRHKVPNRITFDLDPEQKIKVEFILSKFEGLEKRDIYKAIANKGIDTLYAVLDGPKN